MCYYCVLTWAKSKLNQQVIGGCKSNPNFSVKRRAQYNKAATRTGTPSHCFWPHFSSSIMLCSFKIGQNVWDLCKCPMAGRKTSIFAAFPILFCITFNEKMFVIGQVLHITVIMDLNCKNFAHIFYLKQHQTGLIVKTKSTYSKLLCVHQSIHA